MKVERNITVFAGEPGQAAGAEKSGKAQQEKDNQKDSILYAGNFQGDMSVRDRIQQKREQAQKQAMKVVQDAWGGDRAIDEDLNQRRERVRELNQSSRESQVRIDDLREQQEKLKDAYGITEDSQEQQELELLRRRDAAVRGGGSLSEEEMQKCDEIEKRGLSDYQKEQLNLDEHIRTEQDVIDENGRQVVMENAVIRGTRLERLKYHHMADAQKEAEDIKKAAGDEIMGMLVEDAKEHVDEEQEEREEKAEEIKEKKEEQEELVEKRREDKEELVEDMPVDEMLDLSKTQEGIQQEVQNIMNKMALVAEDIKGAVVDTGV